MNSLNYTIAVMIHNVEKFLPDCIDSCIKQQGNDLEILLIDDGSTDSSAAICDNYAGTDARINVIHNAWGGVSAARNTAIEKARGKWLVMVDGDDMLSDGAIEYGRRYIDDDSDLLQFDAVTFTGDMSLAEWTPKGKEMVVSQEKLKEYHIQLIDRTNVKEKFPTYNLNPAWAKMWSMDFIREHNLRYDEKVHKGEGTLFTFLASYYITKIKIIPFVLYGYRINQFSTMHRFSGDILDNQNAQWTQYNKAIWEHGEQENKSVMDALNRRGLYLIENALHLGIAHSGCIYSRVEKLAWAKKLCDYAWVSQAVKYGIENNRPDKLYSLINKHDVKGIVRYCNRIKRRSKLRSRMKRFTGERAIKYYRKIRYRKTD